MQKYVGWIFVRDDGGRKFYTTGSGDSTKAHGWDEQGLMAAVSFLEAEHGPLHIERTPVGIRLWKEAVETPIERATRHVTPEPEAPMATPKSPLLKGELWEAALQRASLGGGPGLQNANAPKTPAKPEQETFISREGTVIKKGLQRLIVLALSHAPQMTLDKLVRDINRPARKINTALGGMLKAGLVEPRGADSYALTVKGTHYAKWFAEHPNCTTCQLTRWTQKAGA
jgi:hypothetical protein